jgi:hypothetical protein
VAPAVAAARPALTLTGLLPGQVALVTWAIDLFDEADLALPPLDVVRRGSKAPCLGRQGRHVVVDGRSLVSLCTDESGGWVEILVLHELSHAWEHASLSDATRAAYLAWRHLPQWRVTGPDDTWYSSGAEHAAVVMVWGLIDRPFDHRATMPGYDCDDLDTAYRMLTGQAALHGLTKYCSR